MTGSVKQIAREIAKTAMQKQKVEMADAHCHLDLIRDPKLIIDAINHGVLTMITNGISTGTNKRALQLADRRYVFPALGVDPETAAKADESSLDDMINENVELIRANREKIVAIGEIGLDYTKAGTHELVAKQRTVFERMLELAKELTLPVSVHSRDSMDEVLEILSGNGMERVHLHFFEGNVQQAKEAEKRGYMISIPPVASAKRKQVIKDIAIDRLMAESDSPVVGATPKDVDFSINMIAEIKGIEFNKAAEILTGNTKRFFGIDKMKPGFMRG